MPGISRARHGETSIDWLSATMDSERSISLGIKDNAFAMLRLMSDAGNLIRPMSSLGYVGTSVSGSFVGDRFDGLFVRFTGAWADKAFWNVFYPGMHVSRLDLQVTYWNGPKREYTGNTARRQANDKNATLVKNKRRKVWEVCSDDGGHSVYVGSRKSEQYCRVYNKGAESKEKRYQHSWRYEVEYHNQYATSIAEQLYRRSDEREQVVSATVAQFFNERGITVPWTSDKKFVIMPSNEQPVSDIQTSLEWLRKQVRPTVKRLIGLGFRGNVIEALALLSDEHAPVGGLEGYVIPD